MKNIFLNLTAILLLAAFISCSGSNADNNQNGDYEYIHEQDETDLPDGDPDEEISPEDETDINIIVDGDAPEYGAGDEEYNPDVHALPPLEVANIAGVSGRNIRIVWVPTEKECDITIERVAGSDDTFETVAIKDGKHGRFLDLGLEPETWYRYKLTACNNDGCSPAFESIPIQTKESIAPDFTINVNKDTAEDNLILFGVSTVAYDYTEDGRMLAVDRSGKVIWEYHTLSRGAVTEIQPRSDHTFSICTYANYTHIDLDSTEIFHYEDEMLHHDINPLEDGRIISLFFDQFYDSGFQILSDGIVILDEENKKVDWRWYTKDYISLEDRSTMDIATSPFGLGQDWTHSNSVHFDEEKGKIRLNVRNLNRIYQIDYPSGDIDWIMGDGGDFGEGLWSHAHDPNYLGDNKFIIFDNGLYRPGTVLMYSRVIEVEFDPENKTAEIVWEYREKPDFYSNAYGSVKVMDNGNILINDGINGRVLEVTRDKEKVWEMKLSGESIYKAETVPLSFFKEW